MSFLSLPLEIHQRVISYLLSNRDVAALSAQCRTLHSLCDMATRKKYHRVSVSSNDEDNIEISFALLMEILKRPSLGDYVRHIECRTATSRHLDYKQVNSQRDLSNEEMTLVREAVKKGGFRNREHITVAGRQVRRGHLTPTHMENNARCR
ncbi:F-box domain protein [Penicillium digitatum]|uniref:F-box domain protein n=1 Tax=Penicillium digitatum TaxID=36651 RepID=A0A7T7BMQ6_PENDI|nr:F-box domain protein [Penicillium digitatum]